MIEHDKQLLIKDLCARLPYGVKINHTIYGWTGTAINFNRKFESFTIEKDNGFCYGAPVEKLLPYLRPMSSMTEKEKEELSNYENSVQRTDFFYSHHVDCRFMIEKGLALIAPEGMYKIE